MLSAIIDNASNKRPCIRCGVCCSSGVCSYGLEDYRGLCAFLFIDRYGVICHTSCKLVLDKKVDIENIGIGKGCVLRQVPFAYEYYLEQMRCKLAEVR